MKWDTGFRCEWDWGIVPRRNGLATSNRSDTHVLSAECLALSIRLPDVVRCMTAELCFYCWTVKQDSPNQMVSYCKPCMAFCHGIMSHQLQSWFVFHSWSPPPDRLVPNTLCRREKNHKGFNLQLWSFVFDLWQHSRDGMPAITSPVNVLLHESVTILGSVLTLQYIYVYTQDGQILFYYLLSWCGTRNIPGEEIERNSLIKHTVILCLLLALGILKKCFPFITKCWIYFFFKYPELLLLAGAQSLNPHWLKAVYSHISSPPAVCNELVLRKMTDLWSSACSLSQEKSCRRSRGCDLSMSRHLSPHQRRHNKILPSWQSCGSSGKCTAVKPPAAPQTDL